MSLTAPLPGRFEEVFGDVLDPRLARTRRYPLLHLLFMAFCAVLSHCEDWDQIAAFVKAKKSWFETFFPLPDGTPCADTFSRVMGRLAPQLLNDRWPRWLAGLSFDLTGQVIAFDGKASRGAVDPEHPTQPLYLLHVFATESDLLLGQLEISGAAGEIAASREMLKLLDLSGSILTFDANGCTQANAAQIVEHKADYVFGLKGNRGPIFEQTQAVFASDAARARPVSRVDHEHDKGHGRLEHRTTRTLPATLLPAEMVSKWKGLVSLVEVERTREVAGETSTEKHWYLTSLPLEPGAIHRAIRAHWGIENRLHWVLDVSMGEDQSRVRAKRAASNLALLRRLALSLVSRPEAGKDSRVMKLRRAGWDDGYRLELLRLNATAVQKPAELRCAGPGAAGGGVGREVVGVNGLAVRRAPTSLDVNPSQRAAWHRLPPFRPPSLRRQGGDGGGPPVRALSPRSTEARRRARPRRAPAP